VKQLGLFDEGSRTIADDERGRIVYRPAFLSERRQHEAFESLLETVEWRAERRMMYDREVDVPRLVASFRVDDLPEPLRAVLPDVEEATQTRYTAVGLNLYRNGSDSVAPHNDHLDEIAKGNPIALLSLGAPRKMTIRSKAQPRRILDLDLEPGSLLVMSYETQLHYDHGIPKTKAEVGARISAAFRVRLRPHG
jgi:alkylated DNA repair dioxygenase AlkB